MWIQTTECSGFFFLQPEEFFFVFLTGQVHWRQIYCLCLSGDAFIYLSFFQHSFARYITSYLIVFYFSILNISSHCVLASLVSDKKTTVNFIEGNLYIKSFSLAVFNIFLFLWLLTVWPKCYDCKFFSLSHWEFVELIRYAD